MLIYVNQSMATSLLSFGNLCVKFSCQQKFYLQRNSRKGREGANEKNYCVATFELHSIEYFLVASLMNKSKTKKDERCFVGNVSHRQKKTHKV